MPVSHPSITAEVEHSVQAQHQAINHNASDLSGLHEPDPPTLGSSRKASTPMGTERTISRLSNLPNDDGRSEPMNQSAPEGSRTGSQAGLLHIPSQGGAHRRPADTAVWDWDTPLETVGESASYYYEPQGELLQETREQRTSGNEFSIPHTVPWSSTSGQPSSSTDAFAVPRRPTGAPTSTAGNKRKAGSDLEGKPPDQRRFYEMMAAESGDESPSSMDARPPMHHTRSHGGSSNRPRDASEGPEGQMAGVPRPGKDFQRSLEDPAIPMILPPRKVFPIQIGDKLFRLSGASISSDAPSYFSQFFEEQLRQNEGADSVRTLYIDRDPTTFADIALHLQGYHIEPRDGPHFVKLFADAQFFSLPRLTAQLFSSTIYIRIGDEEFQIPRDIFSNPGDSPNYFSLGFAIFFTMPTEVFPGLSQRTLLRPPSILPPCIPNRSAKTFADLLHVLKGYPVEIRSEEHRAELLRDARYFHLKGLEQRLIPHSISYNLARKRNEIVIRLEDIRQSGISYVADGVPTSSAEDASPAPNPSGPPTSPGWIYYQRPYVDGESYSLLLEVSGSESTFLSIAPAASSSTPARVGRAMFQRQTLARITSLFSVIANKMNLPITQPLGLMMMERGAGVASLPVSPGNTGVSEERVKVRIGADADVTVDGKVWRVGIDEEEDDNESGMDLDPSESSGRSGKKRKRIDEEDEGEEWVLKKAVWRLRVQPLSGGVQAGRSGMEVILGAVKIEAYSNERARNAERAFLS